MLRIIGLILTLALVASACGNDDGDGGNEGSGDEGGQETSGEPYQVGFMTDLGGPFAGFGAPQTAGFRTFVDHTNSNGGVNGRQIEVSVKDDRSDVQTGQAVWRELVDEGVIGVFGITASAIWPSIAPEAEQVEIPQISAAGIDEFTEVGSPEPFLFKSLSTAEASAEQQFNFVEDELELDSPAVALLSYESPAQRVWGEAAAARADERGWDLVSGPTHVPFDTSDFSSQAGEIVGAGAEVALVSLFITHVPPMVQALRDRGFEGPIVNAATGGAVSEETMTQVADPGYYIPRDFMVPEDPDPNEGVQEMVERTEAAGQTDDMQNFGFTAGYVQGIVLVAALEQCEDPCDGAAFRDALEAIGTIDTNDLTGPSTGYSAENHNLVKEAMFFVYSEEEGHGVPVTGNWVSGV